MKSGCWVEKKRRALPGFGHLAVRTLRYPIFEAQGLSFNKGTWYSEAQKDDSEGEKPIDD